MSKIVGRKPIEIKLYDQQQGRVPVFDSASRLWTTVDRAVLTSGSAITSGSNTFIGNQTISGSLNISGSLTVIQGITGNLTGTASYASNAWAIGGNTFTGGSPERIIGTLSDHNLAIYASGSRIATFTSSGSLLISPNAPNILNNEKILIDAGQTTSFNLIRAIATIDNYTQFNINNQSTGSDASSDIVATADNGSENSNYIDMGINSSNFTGDVGDANDAYLYSTGNDLHIGNASNYPVQFFAGGLDNNANRKLQLSPDNYHQMTGSLDVSGSVVAKSFTGSLQGTASVAVSSSNAATASYVQNAQTASYVVQAQSASYWSGSILNSTSASYATNALSASYWSGSVTNAATASYVQNAQTASYVLNAISASYATTASSADDFTVRGTLTAQTLVAQTITSSVEFVTGSTINGSLLSDTHQFTGSVGITGSLSVNGSDYITTSGSASTRLTDLESFSGVYSTGSFTGSFIGTHTGSFSGSLNNLQNGIVGHIPFFSSSQVLADSVVRQLDNGTGSFSIVINQDNITTAAPEALYVWQPSSASYNVVAGKGNLNNYLQLNIQNLNTGENASSDVVATANNGNETTNYINMGINSEGFTGSVGNENDAYLYSTGNHLHIGNASNFPVEFFAGGIDTEANRKLKLNPNNQHEVTGSLNVSGSIVAHSFTGSLQGTASWANNAINATSASYAITASLAINANNAVNASTASYVLNAQSASYWSGSIINAATASYVLQAVSASFATTASYVRNAQTASYVLNAVSSSFASTASSVNKLNQNVVISGSLTVTGSTNIIGDSGTTILSSNADTLVFTGSLYTTGSIISTGSLSVLGGITGSLFGTASYAAQALTSSFASTASSADNFTVRGTLTAQTLVAQTVTSSIEFVTGSTRNGSTTANTHQFTGSVSITGSLAVNGVDYNTTSASFETRILNNSGSIAQLSGSYLDSSASFDTRITNNSANIALLSGSYLSNSASFDTRIINNSASIASLSGSYLTDSSSFLTRITDNSTSIAQLSGSYLSDSSSFASRITNNSASISSLSGSYLSSSASFDSRINVISSSYATTGSNVFVGNQTITGSFTISGSTTQIGNTTLSGSITVTGSVNALSDINLGGVLRLDSAIDPGSSSPSSSFLFTSASNTATGFDLYYRQNGNLVKFKWMEGVLNTGVLYGGILTYSASYFYISSGSGIIVNHNANTGSEISPTIDYISWAASSHSIANPSAQNTYVFIDANGDLQQQTSFFTPEQYHEVLPIGRVSHYGAVGTTVTGVGNNILTSYDVPQQLGEFARAFGPLKISGFTITPQVGNLSLNIGSGTAFNLGGYYQNTPDLPSSYNSNTYLTSSIIRLYRSGSGFQFDNNGGSYYTSVDPTLYDNGTGTLATVGNGNWSIQRVFVNPITGRSHVYYGQSTYASYLTAISSLSSDDFVESEVTKNAYVFAGYLVMNGNASNTDLSIGDPTNAIIQAGLFRNSVGGSGGATTAVSELNDLSDVNISSPSNGQALIYSTGTWINGTPISSSYASTASFVAGISDGTASYANTASFALTASYLLGQSPTSSYALTASYVENAQTASYVLNAQSASFAITASYLLGQSPTASYALTASYVEQAISASYWSGSILNATSASYASTASYADNFTVAGTLTAQTIVAQTITSSIEFITGSTRNGSLLANTHQFTGSILSTGSNVFVGNQTVSGSIDLQRTNYIRSEVPGTGTVNIVGLDSGYQVVIGSSGVDAIIANNRIKGQNGTEGSPSYTFNDDSNTGLYRINADDLGITAGGVTQVSINTTRALFNSPISASAGITGSLFGTAATASYVVQAQSASYWSGSVINAATASYVENAQSASYVLQAQSASYWSGSILNAATASYAVQAESASYWSGSIINAATASYVETAQTASYVVQAQSASYWSGSIINAESASYATNALTASFALTASYISGSGGGVGFPFSGSAIITGSLLVSQSFVDFTQAIYVTGSFTGSLSGTATSASYATFALSAGDAPGTTATMTQSVAATTWSFTHNLNTRNPLLQVYDSNNYQIVPAEIFGSDPNQTLIYFDTAESGYAVASNGGGLTVSGSTARLDQTSAAVTWSFTHNLATKYPNFEIWDSNDDVIIPAGIHAVNDMSAEIYFAFPTTGVAIASFSGINGAPNATTASYAVTATTASYGNNFVVGNTLTIDQTLTDYHVVPSSAAGSNNMFSRATGSYSSAFFKYTVANGSNARSGEVMAVFTGGAIQFTDNSTSDIGDTSGVTAEAAIAGSSIQFNLITATSGWRLKSLATFM